MKKFSAIFLTFLLSSITLLAQRSNNESLAKEYFKKGEYDKAESIYIKLNQQDPHNTEYYTKYFQCLVIQKKYNEAEKLVKRTIKKSDNYPSYYVDLGLLHDVQGDTSKARKYYEEAIKRVQPDLMQVVDVCAKFTEAQLYNEGLRVIFKARKLTNNPSLMSVDASKIYSLQNNKQGIIEEQLNLFEQNAYDVDQIQQTFQDYFNEAKDYDMLKNVLIQRLQSYPDQVFYAELLIWTFIQQQNFDAAYMQSLALDKRFAEDGQRLYQLGVYCRNNKKYESAIKSFRSVIDKGTSFPYYNQSRTQ